MAFSVKDWANLITGGTPLNASAIEDIEDRLSDYTDSVAAGGVELGHSQITADATRNSTSYADVAGLSTTVTVGSRPIAVVFSCASSNNNNATGGVSVAILEDGTIIGACSHYLGANQGIPLARRIRRAPSPGSHTYKVQLKTLFGGTATISADSGSGASGGPASISVVEV